MRATQLLLTLTLALSTVAPVRAGTYYSPLLQAVPAGHQLWCMVSNVGTTPITISVKVFNGDEVTPDFDTCSFNPELGPMSDCFLIFDAPQAGRCTVEASSSKIRAVLWVQDSSGVIVSTAPLTKK